MCGICDLSSCSACFLLLVSGMELVILRRQSSLHRLRALIMRVLYSEYAGWFFDENMSVSQGHLEFEWNNLGLPLRERGVWGFFHVQILFPMSLSKPIKQCFIASVWKLCFLWRGFTFSEVFCDWVDIEEVAGTGVIKCYFFVCCERGPVSSLGVCERLFSRYTVE